MVAGQAAEALSDYNDAAARYRAAAGTRTKLSRIAIEWVFHQKLLGMTRFERAA